MLLIYLPDITSRTKYVFELIFKNELGLEYHVTKEVKVFEAFEQGKINYKDAGTYKEAFGATNTLKQQ